MMIRTLRRFISSKSRYIDANDTKFPLDDLLIFPDFITEQQEASLTKFLDKKLKRLKYETSHFDHVITGYRETTVSEWPAEFTEIRKRMIECINMPGRSWKPFHVLDLNNEGSIGAHVDHVDYSGHVVSGLCLLSSAVMRFRHRTNTENYADVLLERRCFYVQKNKLRYDYTHELQASDDAYQFKGSELPRLRRMCLLLRDDP